jgi:hypothetical protein
MTNFLLYESASGYGLFEVEKFDELANSVDELQKSILDVARFGKSVKLIAFKPFTSAANALEQINAVSESQVMHAPVSPSFCGRTRCCCLVIDCFLIVYMYNTNADDRGSGELSDDKHAKSKEQLKGKVQAWGLGSKIGICHSRGDKDSL